MVERLLIVVRIEDESFTVCDLNSEPGSKKKDSRHGHGPRFTWGVLLYDCRCRNCPLAKSHDWLGISGIV
jgi:hypothetical protein